MYFYSSFAKYNHNIDNEDKNVNVNYQAWSPDQESKLKEIGPLPQWLPNVE